MKRILVWDLPVRLFHWILAGSFVFAFVIANLFDDESGAFVLHMLLGGVMAFMVLLRVVWGFAGTRWARFSTFAASPREMLVYLKAAVTGGDKRYTGHNPGSSIAALLMFVCVLGLAVTGVAMANGAGEGLEEVHELLAWSMVVLVAAHLAGIAWHTLRHREFIALSMIDGRKEAEASGAIASSRPVVGLAFLVLTALWTMGLVNGYDAATGRLTLPLVGQVLQVGEGQDGGWGEGDEQGEEHADHDEHD